MSPYLAVIRDSFRAALTSRVLWIAFFAIWLLLIALAPIGYREDFTTSFRGPDFHNGTRLKAMLAQGLVDEKAKETPAGRLAAAMPEDRCRPHRTPPHRQEPARVSLPHGRQRGFRDTPGSPSTNPCDGSHLPRGWHRVCDRSSDGAYFAASWTDLPVVSWHAY